VTTPTARAGTRALLDAVYRAPLTHHLRQGAAAAAFDAAERARARTLAELLGSPALRPRSAVAPGLLAQRAALRTRLEQAYAAEPSPAEQPAPAESWSASLARELADLDRRIELADPALAGLTALAPLTVEQVVVTRDDVQAQPIPKPSIQWLRAYLADHLDGSRRGILVPAAGGAYLEPPRQLFPPLYRTLLAPFEKWLEAAQTVYIVPHGPLHYMPLGALTPDLAGPPPLLAAERRVVYTPSATVLLGYCHTRAPSARQGVLAVAPQDAHLQVTQGAAHMLAGHSQGDALLGEAATRQTLLDRAGNYRIVCFLGHGLFDARYPMSSRLQLSDGALYATDILADLRLEADLVVLAACETGRSQVLRGDEILGLTRSVLYAGTPSLLVTLWRVHEAPTRLLVERLFATLRDSAAGHGAGDAAAALAAAQCWLRALPVAEARAAMTAWDDLSPAAVETQIGQLWQMTQRDRPLQDHAPLFTHPFFWSAYILVGDRPPAP
ncbi:MAG: hypothetical protein DCC57_22130, partial [Chloroflexi bacterium]